MTINRELVLGLDGCVHLQRGRASPVLLYPRVQPGQVNSRAAGHLRSQQCGTTVEGGERW